MKASIIKIGNSKGIRIPKKFLELTKISDEVELSIKGNTINIKPLQPKYNDEYLMSLSALRKDWDRPEEDIAWAAYNQDQ